MLTTYNNHPAIYISKRFKTHDHIWFAIMHEIAHLIKHYNKNIINVSYENDDKSTDIKEIEANNFSRDFWIDKEEYNEFIKENDFSEERILAFAKKQNILEGIVVARLQHDGLLERDKLNYKKINIDK